MDAWSLYQQANNWACVARNTCAYHFLIEQLTVNKICAQTVYKKAHGKKVGFSFSSGPTTDIPSRKKKYSKQQGSLSMYTYIYIPRYTL